MDEFERDVARMMCESQETTRYEDRHRQRLKACVRARRRTRAAWWSTGSALSIAGLGAGLMLLQSPAAQGESPGPEHRHVPPAESVSLLPTPSPVSPDDKFLRPTPPRTSTGGPVPMPTNRSLTKPAPMPSTTSPAKPVPMPTTTSPTGPVLTAPPISTAK
ncbi:hypothetical protein ACIBO6_35565 [Streptomyces luteogriseus]|uniref:hypothetical protein n=1 Tax=Streptomyces luteogriseus TaxID=68233 RepID=UPI0037A28F3F